MLKDRTAIVGIGQTDFARQLPQSELELAAIAVRGALADAGIGISEVDGLSSYTMETTGETELAHNLGLGDVTFFSQIGHGGGADCATVGHAALGVASG